jgi:hypothetical protein
MEHPQDLNNISGPTQKMEPIRGSTSTPSLPPLMIDIPEENPSLDESLEIAEEGIKIGKLVAG